MNPRLKNLDPETLAILRELVVARKKRIQRSNKGVNVYIREDRLFKLKSGSARRYQCAIPGIYRIIEKQTVRCATVREMIEILTFIGFKPSRVKV